MPKFGQEVTGMSAVDPRVGNVRAQITESTSAAQGIESLAGITKLGIEAYNEISIAGASEKQQALHEEYLAPRKTAVEVASLQETAKTIFEEGTIGEYNAVTERLTGALSRHQSALAQGIMSPEEFTNRSLSVLRESVNRNPHLVKELTAEVQRAFELSGMQGILKQDIADREAKKTDRNEQEKFILEEAKKYAIDLKFTPTGETDFLSMHVETSKIKAEKRLLDTADRKVSFTENDVRQFGTQYAVANFNKTNEIAQAYVKDPKVSYEDAKLNIKLLFDENKKKLVSSKGIAQITDKPHVKAMIDLNDKLSDSIIAAYGSYKSKEDANLFLKNITELTRNQQSLDVMQIVNKDAVDIYSKLVSAIGMPYLTTNKADELVSMLQNTNRLMEGVPLSGKNSYSKDTTTGKVHAVQVINNLAMEASKKESTPKQAEVLSNSIKTVDADRTKMELSEKFRFDYDYINALAAPENKEGFAKLDDESRSKASTHIHEFADTNLRDMNNIIDAAAKKGSKIIIDTLEDGTLTFNSPNNPELTAKMNRVHVKNINTSMKAITNVNRTGTTKAAAMKFFKSYFDVEGK